MMKLRSRVASACVSESRVDVGLGGSGANGGMGNKESWRGMVSAERRQVHVGSGIGGDESSSTGMMGTKDLGM